MMTAAEVIATLGLKPHPEGGHYRETFRDPRTVDDRSVGTAIYFLLDIGEASAWHRVDATEIWHWHAGAPLVITTSPNGHDATAQHLGPDLGDSARNAWSRPAIGRPPPASAPGRWSAARCRRASTSRASRWPRRIGGRRRGARPPSAPPARRAPPSARRPR